jgi:hypothetical protein
VHDRPGRRCRTAAGLSPILDRTFKVRLVLKAADGVLEIIAGALLLFISPSTIDRIAHSVTAHELGEDPHDRLAHYILHTADIAVIALNAIVDGVPDFDERARHQIGVSVGLVAAAGREPNCDKRSPKASLNGHAASSAKSWTAPSRAAKCRPIET